MSLSNNGSIVAIGTPSNAGNGMNAGHVRVFQNETLGIVENFENDLIFYQNPTNNRVYITTNEPIGLTGFTKPCNAPELLRAYPRG